MWLQYARANSMCTDQALSDMPTDGMSRLKRPAVPQGMCELMIDSSQLTAVCKSVTNGIGCGLQGVAIWQLVTGAAILSPLCISMLWAIYNAIPPYLILHFAFFGRVSLFSQATHSRKPTCILSCLAKLPQLFLS